MLQKKSLPVLYLFVLGSIWGLHFSVIKLAAQSGFRYASIAATTTVGVLVVFLLIAVLRRRMPAMSGRAVIFYLICALTGYVLPFYVELAAAQRIDAGLLTLVVTTAPIFTIAISGVFKLEALTRRRLVGIALGALAALAILVPDSAIPDPAHVPWVLLAFVVPLMYGIYHNYVMVAWPKGSDSWQVACGEALGAIVFFGPMYLWSGEFISFGGQWGAGQWAIAAMIFFGVIEVYLYFEIVRLAGAIFVSLSNYVTIAAGIVFGMLIFDERPSVWVLASVLILCVALYFATETGAPREAKHQESVQE
ncbi:MAG: DMT family transporter [Pseudomonadota bacterium]